MDVSKLLDSLNDKQRQAVTAPAQNHLIIAGAGSGKTRVLVHRIAWLIEVMQIAPSRIMAVTFTNKAAREIQGRIRALLETDVSAMWVGTFHGLNYRFLRAHHATAQLAPHFQVMDSDDQLRLIRRLMRDLEIDEARWQPKQVQWFINGKKDEGVRAHQLSPQSDPYNRMMREIYQRYEETCLRNGVVDFAELLLKSFELLQQHADLLHHYQARFAHVLVDEFQDTNAIQYAWLRLLVSQNNHIMVVGDDDQSIYGWRGAKVENIQRFSADFSPVETIRLEQNYRSTAVILEAANALISRNQGRLGKQLWTSGNRGEAIKLYHAFNEIDEARFVVERIKILQTDYALRDIAILYRSNAQSRVLEEALLNAALPYRIYGGQRFFDRAEIKDILAYCRLIVNTDDDAAFERVINWPTRGIGERTLEALRNCARSREFSLWQAMQLIITEQPLPARAHVALVRFNTLITDLHTALSESEPAQFINKVAQDTGLATKYQALKGEKARAKLENIEELASAFVRFAHNSEEKTATLLAAFLAHTVLETSEPQASEHDDCVQMMTVHSAKGLEFPTVFLVGLEENIFPHKMAMQDVWQVEEERRLCYVGMTRAMQSLTLSYAECRRLHGTESYHAPSRFLTEIPADCMSEVRVRNSQSVRHHVSNTNEHDFVLGQQVVHQKFGQGVVLNCEGSGQSARVQVHFESGDEKWLVVAYANLTIV